MSQSTRRVLGFMPARGGSKRIPKKNIIDFFDRPIMAYPIEAAKRSALFDLIHVSTDDEAVATIAAGLGVDASFKRPENLSDDFTGILPVAQWVLHQFAKQGQHFDDMVILFPCAPFLTASDLQQAYDIYKVFEGQKNLITVCKVPAKLEYYYRRNEQTGELQAIQPGGSFIRSQDLPDAYFETGTFTIFSCNWLLNAESLEDDTRYVSYELPNWKSVDIDTEEDLDYAQALYQAVKTRL